MGVEESFNPSLTSMILSHHIFVSYFLELINAFLFCRSQASLHLLFLIMRFLTHLFKRGRSSIVGFELVVEDRLLVVVVRDRAVLIRKRWGL